MVQNKNKPRGRPRQFDPDIAMSQAMDVFWRNGYAGTSLDDLSAATGMNRPSLYNAFGDKRRIYLALLDRYASELSQAVQEELSQHRPLKPALNGLFRRMLASYRSPLGEARGCILVGPALTEAMVDGEVRQKLATALAGVELALQSRMKQAKSDGELPQDSDPVGLAHIASAILHSLAVQVRAGFSRAALTRNIESVLDTICSTPPHRKPHGKKPRQCGIAAEL